MIKRATALLTSWRRLDNMGEIIESLRSQSVGVEIFLWDNSGFVDFEDHIDLQIAASKNLMCMPRWTMAQYASTDYVFTLDDDLCFKDPEAIEKCCAHYVDDEVGAFGKEGVRLQPGRGYGRSRHTHVRSNRDERVDIIKGRFLFTSKHNAVSALRGSMAHLDAPRIEDDIVMSANLWGPKVLPRFLAGSFKELPEHGNALYKSNQHAESRERTSRTWFPQTQGG